MQKFILYNLAHRDLISGLAKLMIDCVFSLLFSVTAFLTITPSPIPPMNNLHILNVVRYYKMHRSRREMEQKCWSRLLTGSNFDPIK